MVLLAMAAALVPPGLYAVEGPTDVDTVYLGTGTDDLTSDKGSVRAFAADAEEDIIHCSETAEETVEADSIDVIDESSGECDEVKTR